MGVASHNTITTKQRLTSPLNGTIFTATRPVAVEKKLPVVGDTMEAELGAAYKTSRIIAVQESPAFAIESLVITHAIIPSEEDQLASNWEHSTCDLGGVRFDSITRTVIELASDYNSTSPAPGSAMPVVPGGLFNGEGHILVNRRTMISGTPLEPVFRVEKREFVKRSTITELGVDSLNGKILTSKTDLYFATEVVTGGLNAAQLFAAPTNAYWGLQADGTQRTGKQLTTTWYMIETSQVVSGTFVDGVVEINNFTTNDNYEWPPVLAVDGVEFMDWARRDGGVDIFPRIVYAKEGYGGPCLTTVTTSWSKTAFSIPKADQMLPVRMSYSSPFFSVNVPPCLHGAITFVCDIGSTDPVYSLNSGSSRTFDATIPTDWPATITAYDDQQPFRGGYLRTTKVVSAPSA